MLPLPPDLQTVDRCLRFRQFLWYYAVVTSVVTTKHLLLDQNFTYPTFILFIAVCGHLFIVLGRLPFAERKAEKTAAVVIEDEHLSWTFICKTLTWHCTHVVVTTLSLLLGYQALLHLPSFSSALMLLTIPLPTGYKDAVQSHFRWLLLILCGAVVVFSDYRLIPNGVLLALGSRTCGALAHWVQASKVQTSESLRTTQYLQRLRNTTPVLQALVIGFLCSIWEMPHMRRSFMAFGPPSLQQRLVLVANGTVSGYALWYSGSVFHRIQEPPWFVFHHRFFNLLDIYDMSATLAYRTVCVAVCMYIEVGRSGIMSLWQLLAFFVACSIFKTNRKSKLLTTAECSEDVENQGPLPSAVTPPTQRCKTMTDNAVKEVQGPESNNSDDSSESPGLVVLVVTWRLGTIFASVFVLVWSAFWTMEGMFNTTTSSPNAVLSRTYSSHRGLDIVVSRYNESVDDLIYITNRIQQLPNIEPLNPRIVIYNKNNVSTDEALYNDIYSRVNNGTEVLIQSAPNIGRESETYLHYMVEHWDELPTHTLFMQGHVHNEMEFLRRIQDYFVPSTGFLSLGFAGQVCSSCDQCSDRHGWLEQPSVLHDISRLAHGSTDCKDIVLTYKGQFIASATRIRDIELDNWRLLQEHFNNPNSPVHTMPYLQARNTAGRQDSLDAPVFGFTMERMWGVMMQCSTMRIAERCPSLYAGLFQWRVNVGLCQCLDV